MLSRSGVIGVISWGANTAVLRAEVQEDAIDWGLSFILALEFDEGELRVRSGAKLVVEDVGGMISAPTPDIVRAHQASYREVVEENLDEYLDIEDMPSKKVDVLKKALIKYPYGKELLAAYKEAYDAGYFEKFREQSRSNG